MKYPSPTLLVFACLFSIAAAGDEGAKKYDALIAQGNKLLADEKPKEAYAVALEAANLDANRFEGYALAAMIMQRRGASAEAEKFIAKAIKLAPAEKQPTLEKLRTLVQSAASAAKAPAGSTQTPPQKSELPPEGQRQLDALRLIANDAYKSTDKSERLGFMREFLAQSNDFVIEHPRETEVVIMRAIAALELDYPSVGSVAGRQLQAMGVLDGKNISARKVIAQLESKEWLGEKWPYRDWSTWTVAQVQQAAVDGDLPAQVRLGYFLSRGNSGLPRDNTAAVQWWRRAADKGDPDGIVSLGLAYHIGIGVMRDEIEAANLYKKSALLGLPQAQYFLGMRLSTGNGVKLDYTDAARWHRMAAVQGDRGAQYQLGCLLYQGFGVERDQVEAVQWWRKAAENGDLSAQLALAEACIMGKGTPKNEAEGIKWERKAADGGESQAQFQVGYRLDHGTGVQKDEREAVKWYRRSANSGNKEAQKRLTELEANNSAR